MMKHEKLRTIFKPEEKDASPSEIFEEIDKLRSKLDSKKFSSIFFTLILDAMEKNGEVCTVSDKIEKSEEINDFEVVGE